MSSRLQVSSVDPVGAPHGFRRLRDSAAPRQRPRVLASSDSLDVRLADGEIEISRALSLRWQVFAGELGASLGVSAAGINRPGGVGIYRPVWRLP
jgi:putative hemolysin